MLFEAQIEISRNNKIKKIRTFSLYIIKISFLPFRKDKYLFYLLIKCTESIDSSPAVLGDHVNIDETSESVRGLPIEAKNDVSKVKHALVYLLLHTSDTSFFRVQYY